MIGLNEENIWYMKWKLNIIPNSLLLWTPEYIEEETYYSFLGNFNIQVHLP